MEIRTITDDEVDAFRASLLDTFGIPRDADPNSGERVRRLIDFKNQAWAVIDNGRIVGTAGTFALHLGIPGGTLPVAGLTMVTVAPTHRRRGLLRQLMQRHLDDAKERGYAVSGLWASEAKIYGRFGYAIAAEHDAVEIADARHVRITPRELDTVEMIDEPRARAVFPEIYARATAQRPGVMRRTETWWEQRGFLDTPWQRGSATPRRYVVAKRGSELVGFVVYRQKLVDGPTPGGQAKIVELHGIDTRAEATLWSFMLQLDLFHHVSWWAAPVDDPLTLMVDDPRLVSRTRSDNLWLRIEDPAAALRARRFASDGVLRFTSDGTTYELVVEDGRGTCAPTSATGDLVIDRTALGALYLGGFTATRLARAGLLGGDARAIALADRLFASPLAPWCAEVF